MDKYSWFFSKIFLKYKLSKKLHFSDCDNVVLPDVIDKINGKEREFCPRCDCKYESRNTTTIKVKVIDPYFNIKCLPHWSLNPTIDNFIMLVCF